MIVVLGEQVIDRLVQPDGSIVDVAGGAPANVAVGLARLGHDVALRARTSADALGVLARARLDAHGVRTDLLVAAEGASSSAVVRPGPAYDFHLEGAVDFGWTDEELATVELTDDDCEAIVVGSVAMALPPGAEAIERWVARQTALVFYDPNLRPSLGLTGETERVERQVTLADIIKVSEEDLEALHPDVDPVAVCERWSSAADLVVLTRGAEGSIAFADGLEVARAPAVPVTVVDTVGAGDAFLAGLISSLLGGGTPAEAIGLAGRTAAEACARAGA